MSHLRYVDIPPGAPHKQECLQHSSPDVKKLSGQDFVMCGATVVPWSFDQGENKIAYHRATLPQSHVACTHHNDKLVA